MRRFAFVFAALALAAGCKNPPSTNDTPGPTQPTATAPSAAPKTPVARRPATAPTGAAQIGQPIPAFAGDVLPVGGGAPATIDSSKQTRPTAYVMLGTTCPATGAYTGRLVELEQRYGGKVDFVYVYPNKTDAPEAKVAFHQQHKFTRGHIDDQGGKIARVLGAQRTSEVFLTDAKGTLVYHGAIDDNRDAARVTQPHLAMALDEMLGGKPVTTPTTTVHA